MYNEANLRNKRYFNLVNVSLQAAQAIPAGAPAGTLEVVREHSFNLTFTLSDVVLMTDNLHRLTHVCVLSAAPSGQPETTNWRSREYSNLRISTSEMGQTITFTYVNVQMCFAFKGQWLHQTGDSTGKW